MHLEGTQQPNKAWKQLLSSDAAARTSVYAVRKCMFLREPDSQAEPESSPPNETV